MRMSRKIALLSAQMIKPLYPATNLYPSTKLYPSAGKTEKAAVLSAKGGTANESK